MSFLPREQENAASLQIIYANSDAVTLFLFFYILFITFYSTFQLFNVFIKTVFKTVFFQCYTVFILLMLTIFNKKTVQNGGHQQYEGNVILKKNLS